MSPPPLAQLKRPAVPAPAPVQAPPPKPKAPPLSPSNAATLAALRAGDKKPITDPSKKEAQDKVGNGAVAAGLHRGPGSDPKFAALKKDVANKKRTVATSHPAPHSEATSAQAAAVPPKDDEVAQGKTANAEKMNDAKPKDFDKDAFIKAVEKAIAEKAPKNLEEADKFADSDKPAEIKKDVQGKVGEGKSDSAEQIATTTAAPPDTSAAETKQVVPMTADRPPGTPGTPDPTKATPDKLPPSATDMSAGPAAVNQEMTDAQVTEPQLKKSNEPTFNAALKNKKTAEQHSETAPDKLRKHEAAQLQATTAKAKTLGTTAMAAIANQRVVTGQHVGTGKKGAKTRDEDKRAEVTATLQKVFDTMKTDVEGILKGLDKLVDDQFTRGEKEARDAFTAEHKQKMAEYKHRRYSGWGGPFRWAHDKLLGLPDEANKIFEVARDHYVQRMKQVISSVADTIGRELTRAKQRIAKGREELQNEVKKLPKDLQAIGKEAAAEFSDKFDELTQSVDDKSNDLVDTLATKYTDAVKSVDAEIAAEKEKNKGLVDKAIDAVKGVIQTIMELKNLLLGVLAKAAQAVMGILKDPVGFLGNLISAVGGGLKLFMKNAGKHLEQGVLGWLLGTAATVGLQLPTTFDIMGILLMLAALLGLSWANIRSRLVRKVPEKAVVAAETAVPLVLEAKRKGIAGLWSDLKTRVGDLKKDLISNLVSYLLPTIIIAGITWIVSLFSPASAFIRACKMIIDIIRFIVTNGRQIIEFVNAVLDAVIAITKGGTGGVPALVEKALARSIPVLIGALAALLGIGGIAGKVKQIFQKLARPVNKAVDWVVDKIVGLVKKLWTKLKSLISKGKKGPSLLARAKAKIRGGDDSPEGQRKRLTAALAAGVSAVNKYKGRTVAGKILKPLLTVIRIRYGLNVLEPVVKGDHWAVYGRINPEGTRDSEAKTLGQLAAATRTATGEVDPQALDKLMASLPYVPREDGPMKQFARQSVRSVGEITFVPIEAGGARGVSGAPVTLVVGPDNKKIAALKVFPNPAEFAQEVSALVRLGRLPLKEGRAVRPLGVARTSMDEKPAGMLVSTAGAGEEVDKKLLRAARAEGPERQARFAEAREAVEATGRALAGLHVATGSGRKPSSPYMARYIRSMRDILSNLRPMRDLLTEFGTNLDSLGERAEALIAQFEANPGGSAIVHGDAHPGNFFYERGTGVTMIDTPSVHFSMDARGRAMGSPSRDVSYFIQKVAAFGASYDLSPAEVVELQMAFRQGYAAAGGPNVTPEADAFFRARTVIGELIGMANGVRAARDPKTKISPEVRAARERAFRTKARLANETFGLG